MRQYPLTRDLEDVFVDELNDDVSVSVRIFEEGKKEFRVIVDATLNTETGFASHTVKTLDEAFEYLDDPGFNDDLKEAVRDLTKKVLSSRKDFEKYKR